MDLGNRFFTDQRYTPKLPATFLFCISSVYFFFLHKFGVREGKILHICAGPIYMAGKWVYTHTHTHIFHQQKICPKDILLFSCNFSIVHPWYTFFSCRDSRERKRKREGGGLPDPPHLYRTNKGGGTSVSRHPASGLFL